MGTPARGDDGVWRDEEELPLDELDRAMATYSSDGQVDDLTGGDAGAEEEFGDEPGYGRPSPDGPAPDGRSGPM
jgi:hypothetical protein